jgi:hypothetical protein
VREVQQILINPQVAAQAQQALNAQRGIESKVIILVIHGLYDPEGDEALDQLGV